MDPSHSILMLILAFFLVALNAFFVLSEFSIVKIRKSKLEEFVAADVANARLALKISNSLDTYLSATQLGITISSLALGWIGEPAVSKLIEGPLKKSIWCWGNFHSYYGVCDCVYYCYALSCCAW